MLEVLPSEGELEVLDVCKGELKCEIKWMQNAMQSQRRQGKDIWKERGFKSIFLKKRGAKMQIFQKTRSWEVWRY